MNLKKSFSLTFNFSLLTFSLIIALFFLANLFYFPISAKADDSMPKITIPNLQIKIPGMATFSEAICAGEKKNRTCAIPWIGEYIAGVYKYAIGIVGILAAVILMLGGVIWLTAGGNATRVTEAKAWIAASLSGLVIALSSYTILYQVNPDLLKFKPLNIGIVQEKEVQKYIENRSIKLTGTYVDQPCPTPEALKEGIQVYTTGYYPPPAPKNNHKDLCMISMNCGCPQGMLDTTHTCGDIFKSEEYKFYPSCKFKANYEYPCIGARNNKLNLEEPISVAADVRHSKCFNFNDLLCIRGKTYKVDDVGKAIRGGRRIDIWSASVKEANKNSGVATMTSGQCK